MNPWNLSDDELKKRGGICTAEEICQQPEVWEDALSAVQQQAERIEAFIEPLLAKKDLRIIFTGAGTSAYAGDIIAPYLRQKLGRDVLSFATTDIVSAPYQFLQPDLPTVLVSFARSGDSPESIGAFDLAEQLVREVYQIVITCNPQGALARKSAERQEHTLTLLMPPRTNDRGFAMTSSFSCMLLTGLLIFDLKNLPDNAALVKKIAGAGRRVLSAGHGLPELATAGFERIVFLGSGALYGLARETCLKVLELTGGRIAAVAETMMGFRHGPKSIVNDRTLIVMWLSSDSYIRQYDMDLLREFHHDAGDFKVLAVSAAPDGEVAALADYVLALDEEAAGQWGTDSYLALGYVLFDHILALAASMGKGVAPDTPCPSGSVNRVVKGVTLHSLEDNH
ncbi:MAG: SIS domain-containing protein [Selenomonadaceae bacterium]|nr:SIS domain-containing protein [Selenomonadaceae bacterium]